MSQLPESSIYNIISYVPRSTMDLVIMKIDNDTEEVTRNDSSLFNISFEIIIPTETPEGKPIRPEYYIWLKNTLVNISQRLGPFMNTWLEAADGSYARYFTRLLNPVYDFRYRTVLAERVLIRFEMYTRRETLEEFRNEVVDAMNILLNKVLQKHDAPAVPVVYPSSMTAELRKYYNFTLKPYYMYKMVKPFKLEDTNFNMITISLQTNTNLPLNNNKDLPALPRLKY